MYCKNENRTCVGLDCKLSGRLEDCMFCYLGCDLTYDADYDVDNKLAKFESICDIIRQVLSGKRDSTRIF